MYPSTTDQIHCVSAALLTRSITTLFPKSQIINYGQSKRGFFCLCKFPHPFDNQALQMVEEELRREIQENIVIESVEMMRENAVVLLEHHGHQFIAEKVKNESSNIAELVRIGEFYGLCSNPGLTGTKQIGAIKLFFKKEEGFVKIEGVAREHNRELKRYLKEFEKFVPHEKLGKEAGLFSLDQSGCIWAPRGELIRETLINWWKLCHRKLGFSIYSTSMDIDEGRPPFEYGIQLAEISEKKRLSDEPSEGGLFDLNRVTVDRSWWALDEQRAVSCVNSYLQFINKTVNMIPIDCSWIFYNQKMKSGRNQKYRDLSLEILSQSVENCGIKVSRQDESPQKYPAIELMYKDSLGREWPGPRIELREAGKLQIDESIAKIVMVGSIFRSLESLIAILLESTQGELPFWLAPEQVRVLPVKQEDIARAAEIVDELTEYGCRATCDVASASLSEKVYVANQSKIPYVVVIGKNEREKRTVSVKSSAKGNKASIVSFDLFMEELRKQKEKAQFPY